MINKFLGFEPDKSKLPSTTARIGDEIDLSSHKFQKIWFGPNHPGVTGNMAMELTVQGNTVVRAKTHVGYLHRGFEKLIERRLYIQGFPTSIRMCVAEPDTNEYLIAACTEELSGYAKDVPEMAKWLRMLSLVLCPDLSGSLSSLHVRSDRFLNADTEPAMSADRLLKNILNTPTL